MGFAPSMVLTSKGKNYTRGWTGRKYVKQKNSRTNRADVRLALRKGEEISHKRGKGGFAW